MKSAFTFIAAGLAGLGAQSAQAQTTVPVRDLAPTSARSTPNFGNIFGVRQLTGGKVLVNDGIRRQLTVLDSTLTNATVLIDSTSGSANSYGPRSSPIIAYLDDSTLFVDGTSLSLVVIDPNGRVTRVMSAPIPGDLRYLQASASGVDDKGRLIYRAPMVFTQSPGGPALNAPQVTDSAAIVRADFDTRKVDTIGRVKIVPSRPSLTQDANGKMKMKMIINPLVAVDEWAVLSEGSVAFVRGHDYHVDWLHPDGTRSSSGKFPFDWKRLTDEDKQHLIDSARTAQQAAQAKTAQDMKSGKLGAAVDEMAALAGAKAAAGGGGGGGGTLVVSRAGGGDGGGSGGAPGTSMAFGIGPGGLLTPETEYVPLKEIADYYPPIRSGAAKADLDGNLWILPTTSAQSKAGELVYDVVNNKGELTERVRVPAGRSIAGFGRGGVVYLMSRDASNNWFLERTRILGGKRVAQ